MQCSYQARAGTKVECSKLCLRLIVFIDCLLTLMHATCSCVSPLGFFLLSATAALSRVSLMADDVRRPPDWPPVPVEDELGVGTWRGSDGGRGVAESLSGAGRGWKKGRRRRKLGQCLRRKKLQFNDEKFTSSSPKRRTFYSKVQRQAYCDHKRSTKERVYPVDRGSVTRLAHCNYIMFAPYVVKLASIRSYWVEIIHKPRQSRIP